MPQPSHPCECRKDEDSGSKPKRKPVSVLAWIIAASVFVVSVAFLIWVAHYHVADSSYRIKFFADSSLNLLILFAILVQAYIYIRQWDAMERSLEYTDKSIKQAEESSILAQRAYVVAKIKDTGPYDEGFQFRLIIENGGNTPANNVCVHYWCDFGEPPWPMQSIEESPPNAPIRQVVFETTKAGTTERLGVIGPRGSYVFTTMPPVLVNMPLGSDASKRWESGQDRFYCWGTILYEDMFKKARQSHFCFSLWRKTAEGYLSFEQIETGYPCVHGNYVT